MVQGVAAAPAYDVEAALEGCARKDERALRAIYDAEAGRMLGVAQRVLKRRALAEEAVHDTFIQIWRAAASFDPARGGGRTWIYAILRNRALNILRDESRADPTDTPLAESVPSDDEDPEAVVVRLSEASALRRCLERLEPKRRGAIVLAYTQGLSHGEVAGRLGLPLGTIKAWIRRGLLALKECLA